MKVRRYIDLEVDGLGERIKKARKKDGRSVEVLAGAVGISRSYWHEIEGERMRDALSEEMLRKIETVLDIDTGVYFEGENALTRRGLSDDDF